MTGKLILDLALAALIFLLMSYALVGEFWHEVLGVAIFFLAALHQLKNKAWYLALPRGNYNLRRAVLAALNLLLLILMLLQIFSGVVLSKELFSVNLGVSAATMRLVHLAAAYWLFVLIFLHAGLHWRQISSFLQKKFPLSKLKFVGLAIAAYGVYAFKARGFWTYMTLESEFIFLDFSEPLIFFLADYAAIAGLWILVGNFLARKL